MTWLRLCYFPAFKPAPTFTLPTKALPGWNGATVCDRWVTRRCTLHGRQWEGRFSTSTYFQTYLRNWFAHQPIRGEGGRRERVGGNFFSPLADKRLRRADKRKLLAESAHLWLTLSHWKSNCIHAVWTHMQTSWKNQRFLYSNQQPTLDSSLEFQTKWFKLQWYGRSGPIVFNIFW